MLLEGEESEDTVALTIYFMKNNPSTSQLSNLIELFGNGTIKYSINEEGNLVLESDITTITHHDNIPIRAVTKESLEINPDGLMVFKYGSLHISFKYHEDGKVTATKYDSQGRKIFIRTPDGSMRSIVNMMRTVV